MKADDRIVSSGLITLSSGIIMDSKYKCVSIHGELVHSTQMQAKKNGLRLGC